MTSADEIKDALLAIWREEAAKAGGPPLRSVITPARLGARLLPYVSLLDVISGPPLDFRYRLIGEMMRTAFGANLAGQLHSTWVKAPKDGPKPVLEAYTACVETRLPATADRTFRTAHDTPKRLRVVVCPLVAEIGGPVTSLIGAGLFEEAIF
ncbi:MAG: PAS domain-containing protein [Alphaproteobacteria bacterium]|nr:PAS domain-containing protein [Alphaproteobacteria bacterium]